MFKLNHLMVAVLAGAVALVGAVPGSAATSAVSAGSSVTHREEPPRGDPPAGRVLIQHARGTKKGCLWVNPDDQRDVRLQTCDRDDKYQQWVWQSLSNNRAIINEGNGLCLDERSDNWVITYRCKKSYNQSWIQNGFNPYYLYTKESSHWNLSVDDHNWAYVARNYNETWTYITLNV
ncbi:RICIN domain-containing protein [Streptomyces badius]|uniref:Ricin B lectin domain-containing protein n=1 Tax=Streptomyces badius TaxID=1941 RepID=A0ABQ2TNA9_STRBA|nr:RICIN domain-containing protein [Streptomyces badius]GGS80067.1 hypothetical protein GCM10010253_63490 [Streptomyces badius]